MKLNESFLQIYFEIEKLFLIGFPVSPNAICVPVMKSTKAPKDETVEGELSTMLDTTVEVKSDGTVIVHKPKRKTRNELSDVSSHFKLCVFVHNTNLIFDLIKIL